jgi:hypothetical protein
LQDLLYPDPNQVGQATYGMANNFYADPGGAYDSNVYSFRGDQKISDKNLLFARVGLTMTNGDTYRGRAAHLVTALFRARSFLPGLTLFARACWHRV